MRVESHCFQVYLWERCEESLKFYHEVVVWRDNVKEVFDDADVVVCPALVRSRIYQGWVIPDILLGMIALTLFHTRAWWQQEFRVSVTTFIHDSSTGA